MTRRSGISVPLFSLATTRSWGIGEFPDFVEFARWATDAGQSLVQILPVMELPGDERSPYSALTSFALDPTYIALPLVPEFAALGGEDGLAAADRAELEQLRREPRVAFRRVRALKQKLLRAGFERFQQVEVAAATERARAFLTFCQDQGWWLEEYALFRALLAQHAQHAWWEWPAEGESASAAATEALEAETVYRMYLQWLAAEQWAAARQQARPLRVFGDLPFMISGNSADVWRRTEEFRLDASVGAPPDAFSKEGQDWGLPPWRWRVMRDGDYQWFRARARRHAELFDGFRIDHLVGLYRTWMRPADRTQPPFFDPSDEHEQLVLGETLVGIFKATGAELIAEDLGTVPDFVRDSIARLGVAGFKVLRWERDWNAPGEPRLDPATFPDLSVATTGTHDIEPLAATMSDEEAKQELETLFGSRSALALVPLQDAFSWPDRINTPSVVDDQNWTWRVPRPVDEWRSWDEARARQQWLLELTRATGRA